MVDIQSQKIRDMGPASSTSIPSWSPDGKYIAFEKNMERDQGWGDSEIAIASLDSGNDVKHLASDAVVFGWR